MSARKSAQDNPNEQLDKILSYLRVPLPPGIREPAARQVMVAEEQGRVDYCKSALRALFLDETLKLIGADELPSNASPYAIGNNLLRAELRQKATEKWG